MPPKPSLPKETPSTDTLPANAPYQPLALQLETYRSQLDVFALTDAEKDEYLEALWLLVVSFVDLDFPALFENSCGKSAVDLAAVPDARAKMILSSPTAAKTCFDAAANIASAPESLITSDKEVT